MWQAHPDRDPLGDVETIGWVRGLRAELHVPNNLTEESRWAKAQGKHSDIAHHDDVEGAVAAVGIDGRVRAHLKGAVVHLLDANECPDVVSFREHSEAIVAKLQSLMEAQRERITGNLAAYRRGWEDAQCYLPKNMIDWAHWCLDHPGALHSRPIELVKEPTPPVDITAPAAIYRMVESAIADACAYSDNDPFAAWAKVWAEMTGTPMPPPVTLLIAPTGSRKSTLLRAKAVRYVEEHRGKSVIIFMPRHKLGDEQIELLRREHPNADFTTAVWRGRMADDPENPGKWMCQRPEAAKAVQDHLLNTEHAVCKQGRGESAIKCPLYDQCGWQRQKEQQGDIWFMAHEMLTQERLEFFGDVGLIMIDELPLDALMFGVDKPYVLGLDSLNEQHDNETLYQARAQLYLALHALRTPIARYRGVPVSRRDLHEFVSYEWEENGRRVVSDPQDVLALRRGEWKGKFIPDIRPDMTDKQVMQAAAKAARNIEIERRVTLWELIAQAGKSKHEQCGRIQMQRGEHGREIRMCGLRPVTAGWFVNTLIADATGDAELLRLVWPQLEVHAPMTPPWRQLPLPDSVRIFQMVDKAMSKHAIAVEGDNAKELKRKEDNARETYAAVLLQALQYGGAPVALITYKSTREWIEQHCHVPSWLTLVHHGDVAGSNLLQDVRALFVVGRPLPPPETVTQQAEALTGRYIASREYISACASIPITPDAKGHTAANVTCRKHADEVGERLRRQACEAQLLHACGRARTGQRTADSPVDVYLWTNVALPELGPVTPMLWDEVKPGLDSLMLATGGVWLSSPTDAELAYPTLLSAEGLKKSRNRTSGTTGTRTSFSCCPTYRYQRTARRSRSARAVFLDPTIDPRLWLESRIGPLAWLKSSWLEQGGGG